MKKIVFLLSALLVTGCSYSGLQGSAIFEAVWDEYATEFNWWRSASMSQETVQQQFFTWADTFEAKRAQLVRFNENEEGEEGAEEGVEDEVEEEVMKLEGSTIIAGTTLSQSIEQYKLALEKLQKLTEQQQELKILTRKICEKQKSSVTCDL